MKNILFVPSMIHLRECPLQHYYCTSGLLFILCLSQLDWDFVCALWAAVTVHTDELINRAFPIRLFLTWKCPVNSTRKSQPTYLFSPIQFPHKWKSQSYAVVSIWTSWLWVNTVVIYSSPMAMCLCEMEIDMILVSDESMDALKRQKIWSSPIREAASLALYSISVILNN